MQVATCNMHIASGPDTHTKTQQLSFVWKAKIKLSKTVVVNLVLVFQQTLSTGENKLRLFVIPFQKEMLDATYGVNLTLTVIQAFFTRHWKSDQLIYNSREF